jgi:putative addiction module component (TIGR02574 family)
MTMLMNRVIDDIGGLSQNEKNNILKVLIASMDETNDENSDTLWANLAKKRYEDIESGKVQTVSWDAIKKQILA